MLNQSHTNTSYFTNGSSERASNRDKPGCGHCWVAPIPVGQAHVLATMVVPSRSALGGKIRRARRATVSRAKALFANAAARPSPAGI